MMGVGRSRAVSEQVDDDYLTVALLAAGLATMARRRESMGEAVPRDDDGLLPAAWRSAFGRLWWRCHEQGVTTFGSDLDLLALCAHPFAAWPVALSLSDHDLQSTLLVDGELSGLAEESARLAFVVDAESELIENRVFLALRTAASEHGRDDENAVDEAYARLRRMLIDHPVLTDHDVRRWERGFPAAARDGATYFRRLVDVAYISRPAQGVQTIIRCTGCGNTLPDEVGRCLTPGCAGRSTEQVTMRALAALFEQHRATRRFIHDPGLVEARIFDRLKVEVPDDQVRLRAYPRLDTLDLMIEFLDRDGRPTRMWGVDAKDQESARLLGRMFSWPEAIPCDRRFLVVPTHRARQAGYLADLRVELDGRTSNVEVVDEIQLVSMVTERVRRSGR